MNTDHHAELYGKLRAAILARHFAIGRYFRTNLFLESTILGTVPIEQLARLSPDAQEVERWKILDAGRGPDNPHLYGSQLMTCLAVEYLLGRTDARTIIKLALQTLASLYKSTKPHFQGYVLRFDAVTNGSWKVRRENDRPVPLYSRDFPIGADGRYIYSTPLNDPRYVRPVQHNYEPPDRYAMKWLCRAAEASMDEHVGLILSYFVLYHLVNDVEIRAEVRRQAANLADYLAEHGYLLVRPAGGLSGHAVFIEYAALRAFSRITGQDFPSRVDFVDALKKADVWRCVEAPFVAATVGGATLGVILAALQGLFMLSVGVPPQTVLDSLGPTVNGTVEAARALALSSVPSCFDVWALPYAQEFAAAYLMKLVEPGPRFGLWLQGMQGLGQGSATGFPPFLGLTALDDTSAGIGSGYLAWLQARRSSGLDQTRRRASDSLFASAVAVVLGAGPAEEQTLAAKLQQAHDEFHGPLATRWFGDRSYWTGQDLLPLRSAPEGPAEDALLAVDYMSALALAWLHVRRQAERGTPVTTPGFPRLPDPALWPNASVPSSVIAAVQAGGSGAPVLPLGAIQSGRLVQDGQGANLFLDPVPRSPEPAPILPPVGTILKEKTVVVPESGGDVAVREVDGDPSTAIIVRNGESVAIDAVSGDIWAGVFLTGRNGPNGWDDRIEYDTKFPYHGFPDAHPYCLLAKFKNYVFVGSRGLASTRYFVDPEIDPNAECPLVLRVNDDAPGNGNGAFQCRVRVWKIPDNGAQPVLVEVPTSMVAGRTYEAAVTMHNTGYSGWTVGGAAPYRLGAHNPTDNTTWRPDARVSLPADVPSNQRVTFRFTVTAPSAPGTYSFQWRMVQEWREWFGEPTRNVAVSVLSATDDLRNQVRLRAYQIWERGGRRIGNDWSDWFAARSELGVPPTLYL
ncbi:MAG TPA: DUF2934 domain-containing protein [Methylomirabilota bacterium]|nr:DUF2934 domain-containing protein [Methylomirabilota bacterium]